MKPTSEAVPRVTKSLVKGPEPDYSKVNSFRFDNSETLISVIHGLLHISFNNGESWEVSDTFKEQLIHFVGIDLFHKGRAFVTSEGGRFHVTEDRGRNWKELHVPKEPDEHIECWEVQTHPIDRRLLLAKIIVESLFPPSEVVYVSNDAGESFRRITTPDNCDETVPTLESYDCYFAVSSEESTLEHSGIYYINKTTYAKEPLTKNCFNHGRTTSLLFYTTDFGKTTRSFEELNDCWIQEIFIFPSNVIVLTSDHRCHAINRLWVSNGGNFQPIHIPDEVLCFASAYLLPLGHDFTSRYDQKRLLLEARINGCKDHSFLTLDLASLIFSKNPILSSDEVSETYIRQLHNLKENCRGMFYLSRYPKQCEYPKTELAHFDNSNTLIFILDGSLHISFNSGESWKSVDGFREVRCVDLDAYHNERAFVTSESRRLHVTEDQGRSWKELIPPDEYTEDSTVYTHPVDRKLLLFHIHTKPDKRSGFCFTSSVIYVSNDAGQSYKRIAPPINFPWTTPNFEHYQCHFAVCSKQSTLDNNGIYYIRKATYAERLELSEDNLTDELESAEEVHTLFYTADFGETTKAFDELNELTVIDIFIFPSSVIVLTSEGDRGKKIRKLWISKGEYFEPVPLPDGVVSLEDAQYSSRDDRKVLLLTVRVNDSKDSSVSGNWLTLDPLNLGFFWSLPLGPCYPRGHDKHEYVERSRNIKGTLWKQIYMDTKLGEAGSCMTKASFDNGKSWTNLKVVDPSGKHKHLFKGDINDVEHCSLQLSGLFTEGGPTTGIIMATGTVGTSHVWPSSHNMTFISRDNGASWEVAFEFPVATISLDFGNIIVAVPLEKGTVLDNFYFSLDQGRTWNEYRFDKPIEDDFFSIDHFGLNALIDVRRKKKSPTEHLFYSIDFSNIFRGTACARDDRERLYLPNGNCIDGKRYSFYKKSCVMCLERKTEEITYIPICLCENAVAGEECGS